LSVVPSCSVLRPHRRATVFPYTTLFRSEAADPAIFLSFPWIDAWWRHFGGGSRPRLVTVWDDGGNLQGLAPLYARQLRLAGLPGPRVLRLMGDEGVGSEYLGFLLRRDVQEDVLRRLAEHLRE